MRMKKLDSQCLEREILLVLLLVAVAVAVADAADQQRWMALILKVSFHECST